MFAIHFTSLLLALFVLNVQSEVSEDFKQNFLYKLYNDENETLGLDETSLQELKNKIEQINVQDIIARLLPPLDHLNGSLQFLIEKKTMIHDSIIQVASVDYYYSDLVEYRNASKGYDWSTIQDFYKAVLDLGNGLFPKLLKVFNIFFTNYGSIINIVEKHTEQFVPKCGKVSPRQYIQNLFHAFYMIEVKGFAIFNNAFEMKKKDLKLTNSHEISQLYSMTKERIDTIRSVYQRNLINKSSEIWNCDPAQPVEGENFIELKNVFRKVLYTENEFYDDDSVCFKQCPNPLKKNVLSPKHQNYLSQRYCGSVKDCQSSDESFHVCLPRPQANDSRRYTSVSDDEKQCDGGEHKVFESFRPGIKIFRTRCNLCKCVCDETDEDSDRYVSLVPVLSDVENNFVVTGVKFEKVNNTLYIKIQQGKLLGINLIVNSTLTWNSKVAKSNKIENSEKNEDKFKLEWSNNRGLALDDIVLSGSEVVTGVTFKQILKDSENYLQLSVRATPLDPVTNELFYKKSYWYTPDLVQNRDILDLSDYDLERSSDLKNAPDGIAHKYIRFTPTKLTSADAGQTVLPLIDAQPVYSDPPIALRGISLDIKRAGTFGGYLMFKLKPAHDHW